MQNQPAATLARMEKDATVTVGWGNIYKNDHIYQRPQIPNYNFLLQECEPSAYGAMAVPSGALRWHCPPRCQLAEALVLNCKGVFISNQDVRQISTWIPASPEMQASKEGGTSACRQRCPTSSHLHLRSGCATQATDMPQKGQFRPYS